MPSKTAKMTAETEKIGTVARDNHAVYRQN